jgi:glycosyltransferase involved in cell wall biosynthesis
VVVGGAMAAKMTKTRHVWYFREILSEFGFLWRFHEPLVSLTSDEIICISRAVASQFKGKKVQKKLNVIYDGIPVSSEPPVKRKRNAKGPYRLLSVGLLAPYKGQDILIRSLTRLLEQGLDVELDLVGGVFGGQTEFKQHLQDLASKSGLQDKIRFLGFQDQIGPFLEASDFFILPSTRPEGLGIVILEAMAKGVPVVATNHGGVLEIIRDGENGILVPPNDHLAMAAAIEGLIRSPERVERLGATGYDTVVKRFSLAESQNYLLNLYNKVW